MNAMKQYVKPSGYKSVLRLTESIAIYDKLLCSGDLSDLKLYRRTINSLREVATHMKSESMARLINLVAKKCERMIKTTEINGCGNLPSFKAIQNLAKLSMANMKDEL